MSSASSLAPCSSCGASTSLVCAVCLKAHFCSRPCAAKAWPGHRAACAEFAVLAALPEAALAPVPPAAPLASMKPVAGAGKGAWEHPGTGFHCAVCGKTDAAVCARCRLVGYCGAEHQRKDWPAHKAVCRKSEFGVVPVLTWEKRMLAEAAAAAPASRAAWAALPPIPEWDFERNGAPPSKIVRAWRKAADSGHSLAQVYIGLCYRYCKGAAKDHKAAAEWYTKAAAQGNALALCNLGHLFEHGKGVAKDLKSAAACYAKAAAQGNDMAQGYLGFLYTSGIGVAQDFKTAVEWYAKAAAQGDAHAQYNLGAAYENGDGVAQDFKAAASWYAKAAAQGKAKALARRAACLARVAAFAAAASHG
jgi:hypothetical protein